jgi:hypothetical protein
MHFQRLHSTHPLTTEPNGNIVLHPVKGTERRKRNVILLVSNDSLTINGMKRSILSGEEK